LLGYIYIYIYIYYVCTSS
jgi:hypothetical protein